VCSARNTAFQTRTEGAAEYFANLSSAIIVSILSRLLTQEQSNFTLVLSGAYPHSEFHALLIYPLLGTLLSMSLALFCSKVVSFA